MVFGFNVIFLLALNTLLRYIADQGMETLSVNSAFLWFTC